MAKESLQEAVPKSKDKISEAGSSNSANRNQQTMRSVRLAENVEIEMSNPSNIWKATILYVFLVLIVTVSTIVGQYVV